MNVKEIVLYSIRSNVDVDTYEKAAKRAEAFMEQEPGYRERELLYDKSSNQWVMMT